MTSNSNVNTPQTDLPSSRSGVTRKTVSPTGSPCLQLFACWVKLPLCSVQSSEGPTRTDNQPGKHPVNREDGRVAFRKWGDPSILPTVHQHAGSGVVHVCMSTCVGRKGSQGVQRCLRRPRGRRIRWTMLSLYSMCSSVCESGCYFLPLRKSKQ